MPTEFDRRLAQVLHALRLVERERIYQAWEKLVRAEKEGVRRALGDVLIEAGWLSSSKLLSAYRELERQGYNPPEPLSRAVIRAAEEEARNIIRDETVLEGLPRCARCGEYIVEEAVERRAVETVLCAKCRAQELKPGEVHCGYRIEGLLAEGRVGKVYAARSFVARIDAALKIIPQHRFRNDVAAHDFLECGAFALKLRAPCLVKVLQTGRWGADTFQATELIRGVTLATYTADPLHRFGPSTWQATVQIMEDLIQAWRFMCEQRIIHGEIRPRKVLIGNDGHARLADLGMPTIRFFDIPPVPNDEHYVAPEMRGNLLAKGMEAMDRQAAGVDLRADLFSLGQMFVDLLLGRWCEFCQLETACAEASLPKQAFELLRKCVAPDPEKRAKNPVELIALLQSLRRALAKMHGAPKSPKG